MGCHSLKVGALVLAVLAMLGCSPALNWREVPLGSARVVLPCKPDRAQREVQLGDKQLPMEMVGCEAGGAMFAASRLRVPRAEQAITLRQWHRASMGSLGDVEQSQIEPRPLTGKSLAVSGQGRAPDGSVIQARFLWQIGSDELLLLAVYAPNISSDMTEAFFVDLKLP